MKLSLIVLMHGAICILRKAQGLPVSIGVVKLLSNCYQNVLDRRDVGAIG